MRATGSQIATMLLVAAVTVLAPHSAVSGGGTGSFGVRGGAAVAHSALDEARADLTPELPLPTTSSAPGTVTVRVAVRGSAPPPAAVIPIYRFYSPKSGTHFYTPSAAERDMVIVRWPDVWRFEGVAYTVNPARNTQPMYRFYNRANGAHFYTASAAERDLVFAKWMNVFSYDGPTYAVTPYAEAGKAPVYRFYNLKNGSHFYTASAEERDHVLRTWPNIYRLEGIAFWLGQ